MISGLKLRAKESLVGKWKIAILVLIIGMIVSSVSNNFMSYNTQGGFTFNYSWIIGIFLAPIFIGQMRIYVEISQKKEAIDLNDVFFGFRNQKYLINVAAIFVKNLYIGLWMLLLIIPGIVKAYAYALTEYIIQDDDFKEKDLTAITTSKEIMEGYKLDLFLLDLSFIGWYILSIFTLGLLLLYVIPYHKQTRVEFLNVVKEQHFNSIGKEII